ncbi:Na(+)-translocating NADH-quinone reductase subunit A [Poseidonocella sp. HB161398]|uniref:Na(+)-translocating NADH-quinone reductase subunit A n=1 Tax=Poseidonocella sp. HB161398 TaxID=2320855 RepID=UPI0011083ED2|nr:Na(+)-translocating NADH-quinone reductase subunit A [Poseidonocella sp. HB161398]
MPGFWSKGLTVGPRGPGFVAQPETVLTDEASLLAELSEDLRVEPLAGEDDLVAQGAPLLRLRNPAGTVLAAPMAGRVGHLDLGPGNRLRRITLFAEAAGGRHRHALPGEGDAAALRGLLQGAGLWGGFRSRPFGRMPGTEEAPAAIFVMALDSRPGAPDPREAIRGAEEAFARGLAALKLLAPGHVFLCRGEGPFLAGEDDPELRVLECRSLHPWGLAGFQIHHHFPAAIGRPVWDIAAEEVAAIGELLATGLLRPTRLVSVTGDGLRDPRLLRCQPWADLRGLAQGHLRPGQSVILSGSVLEGRESRWLRPGDRQATVARPALPAARSHWFLRALKGASRPLPLIPTAAVEHALGGALPAMAFLRALSAGDSEAAARLGALSFLAEDMALADYVTCAEPRLSALLGGLLARIEAEEAA